MRTVQQMKRDVELLAEQIADETTPALAIHFLEDVIAKMQDRYPGYETASERL